MSLTLSIVTPSYNQGKFIRDTIRSVLSQSRKPLEYLVMDGGSKDDTVEILKSYGERIQWVSEPDGGQAAAVNKGIERAKGDIIGWINSDDIYYPGAFETVMQVFENRPDVNVVYGHADHIDEGGVYLEDYYTESWDYDRLKEICFICQPAVFFRKKTVVKYGMLDSSRQFAMDYDLWLRMGKGEEFFFIDKKLAGSRLYQENKTLGQVGKVHLDIMDVLRDDIGYIPDRWLEGSAHSTAGSQGFNQNSAWEYHRYKTRVVSLLFDYTQRYQINKEDRIKEYPYAYQQLRIGIDVSAAMMKEATGVPFYSGSLMEALTRVSTRNTFLLYSAFYNRYSVGADKRFETRRRNVKQKFCPVRLHECERLKQAFEQTTPEPLMRELDYPDVVLCTSFAFSRNLARHTATVYVLYDLSFLEHPEHTTKENYDNCFDGLFNAALYADMFLSISESTKRVFLRYFPHVEEDRVIVITCGVRECFLKAVDCAEELKPLAVDVSSRFWLCVGTVEPRKNLISLIRAYAKLKEQVDTFPLYIAGGKGWLDSEIYEEVGKLGLEKDIRFLGYVSDSQLTALYQSCYATIYPSFYEGFGLPILEAMAAGAPVISSNTTSMPEVGGDTVYYIDPYRIETITDAMLTLQRDSDLRNRLAVRGHFRAVKKFSWNKAAAVTYKALYKAIRHYDRTLKEQ